MSSRPTRKICVQLRGKASNGDRAGRILHKLLDMPHNRAKFIATIPLDALSRLSDVAGPPAFTSPPTKPSSSLPWKSRSTAGGTCRLLTMRDQSLDDSSEWPLVTAEASHGRVQNCPMSCNGPPDGAPSTLRQDIQE